MKRVRRVHTTGTVSRPQRQLEFRVEDPNETTGELEFRPPAPWTFRGEHPDGAPRVCRSNFAWPVDIPGRTGPTTVGKIDRLLHLYSHWGLTEMSALIKIEGEWHLLYDLDTEWGIVREYGFWIEFVSDSQKLVARISRSDATRFGHQTEHGGRTKWAVPLKHYSVHRRAQ